MKNDSKKILDSIEAERRLGQLYHECIDGIMEEVARDLDKEIMAIGNERDLKE